MKIDILTLFPDMFEGVFRSSIFAKAVKSKSVEVNLINFRDYSTNKHKNVDDYPYGGGAGMVLTPQPIFDAVEDVMKNSHGKPKVIMMSPQGATYSQEKAMELSREEHLIFLCGHYEGFDERIREQLVTDEISIGDYVLTGGELPAMVIADSIVRLLPGVLGNESSAPEDSFSSGLLEHPHYTRPADFRGLKVPDILLSGDHAKIAEWRKRESLRRTVERRSDLLDSYPLTEKEKEWLKEDKRLKKH